MLPRAAWAAPGTRNYNVPIIRRGVGDAPYSSFHISRCAYLVDNINPLYWIMDGFIITGHAGRRERADAHWAHWRTALPVARKSRNIFLSPAY